MRDSRLSSRGWKATRSASFPSASGQIPHTGPQASLLLQSISQVTKQFDPFQRTICLWSVVVSDDDHNPVIYLPLLPLLVKTSELPGHTEALVSLLFHPPPLPKNCLPPHEHPPRGQTGGCVSANFPPEPQMSGWCLT